jgi:DNA-cytosine methyltransferase
MQTNQEKWKRLFPDGMNVFCPFDGISATRVALDRLGIPVNNYYSSEIDKPAITIAQKNYPDTIQLGDVCDISGSDLPKIDIMVGGSPCQGFSFAGDQLAFDDPRSALFFEFERLLHEIKPTYFLLENVKMKKEFQNVISSRLNCEPIEINSALLSPQSRRRLYWTNINGIQQPKDLNLVLADILEVGYVDRDKSYCIDANYFKGGNLKSYFEKSRRQLVFDRPCEPRDFNPKSECHHVATATDINGHESIKRVYAETGKSPTLTTMGGGHREPKVLVDRNIPDEVVHAEVKKLLKGSKYENNFKWKWDTEGRILVMRPDGLKIQRIGRIAFPDNKSEIVTGVSQPHTTYRRLSPKECERLQTFPDDYTDGISKTQRYKCLGNSFTVDVIAHILSNMDGTVAEQPEQLDIEL